MSSQLPEFRNVIFAGGGSRCFWQLGFWNGLASRGVPLADTVEFVGSTSAGCAMATAAILNRTDDALALFKEMTHANPRNIHWWNALPRSSAPILPHARMYREALERFVRAEDFARVQTKTVRFLMAGYPKLFSGALGAALGFAVYSVEKRLHDPVHPSWGRRVGFRPVVGDAAGCRNVGEYINLALAASCVPPVLPGGRHAGGPVLDGGLVDNVPLILAADQPGHTLVLLSKRYERPLPVVPSITYVQPSKPIKLDKFDYANPAGIQEVFDLGLADGRRFAGGLELNVAL